MPAPAFRLVRATPSRWDGDRFFLELELPDADAQLEASVDVGFFRACGHEPWQVSYRVAAVTLAREPAVWRRIARSTPMGLRLRLKLEDAARAWLEANEDAIVAACEAA